MMQHSRNGLEESDEGDEKMSSSPDSFVNRWKTWSLVARFMYKLQGGSPGKKVS